MKHIRTFLAPIAVMLVAGPVTGLLLGYALASYRAGHTARAGATMTALIAFNAALLIWSFHIVRHA